MNTGAVSKLLGVSSSTIQRWVKHLGLDMERNEFGHYLYSDDDIAILKQFKEEIQKGVPIQEIQVRRKTRRGYMKLQEKSMGNEKLIERIRKLESELDNKADSVVSYQLLQHRREIEELKSQIQQLQEIVEKSESKTNKMTNPPLHHTPAEPTKRKKRTVFRSIFGF